MLLDSSGAKRRVGLLYIDVLLSESADASVVGTRRPMLWTSTGTPEAQQKLRPNL
jgi:hypothetical protein